MKKFISRKFLVFLINIILVIGIIIKGYTPNTELVILILGNSIMYLVVEGLIDLQKLKELKDFYDKTKM